MNRQRLSQVEASGNPGAYLARHSQRWLRWSFAKHGAGRFPLWDLAAALCAVGRLAQPQLDSQKRLISFDAEATWANFLSPMPG